ncbi:MAG: D-alanyl-D-alanine carboxypeptidase/D-alanyl-D-alanine-endopeptidase [Gemmatimonadetes bacterium]|nr:D-alanyl-D-alanine carboxypeptidase/D-alanyl-D-alanine-endopeptidase [Gemmatimonadota bacterium]
MMRRCALALGTVVASWAPLATAAQAPATEGTTALELTRDLHQLQTTLADILDEPALGRAHVGLVVMIAESGQVLFRHNAERRFVAASTTKLVTGAVALHRLGGDHRWETSIRAVGSLSDGTLDGDLVLVGGGDPLLRRETLETMARSVRAAGIRRITGDIVGDDRAWAGPPWGRGWMWDDLYGSYAAGVSALQVSPARISAELRPGAELGASAQLRILEEGTDLPVRAAVKTGAPGSDVRLEYLPDAPSGRVVLAGWIPIDATRVPLGFAPPHPTRYTADLMLRSLAGAGVEIEGRARRADLDERFEDAAWQRSFRSEPLATALEQLLKVSDNQVAETLLRTLGTLGGDGSAEAGLEVVQSTLSSWGIEPDAYSLSDGSGMSRYNELAPAALVRMLRRTSQLAGFRQFHDALPIASVDGTLSRRFRSTAASRVVRAKTGSLSRVRALAGFVEDGDGETLIFALLLNAYDAPDSVATALEDLLVEQLALYHGPTYPGGRAGSP